MKSTYRQRHTTDDGVTPDPLLDIDCFPCRDDGHIDYRLMRKQDIPARHWKPLGRTNQPSLPMLCNLFEGLRAIEYHDIEEMNQLVWGEPENLLIQLSATKILKVPPAPGTRTTPMVCKGYARMVWDLLCGRLVCMHGDEDTLIKLLPVGKPSRNYPVLDIEAEYGISAKEHIDGFAEMIHDEAARLPFVTEDGDIIPLRAVDGIRLGGEPTQGFWRCKYRDGNGHEQNRVRRTYDLFAHPLPDDERLKWITDPDIPWSLEVPKPKRFNSTGVDPKHPVSEAMWRYVSNVERMLAPVPGVKPLSYPEHSWAQLFKDMKRGRRNPSLFNLLRMPADAWLSDRFKRHMTVLSGDGGNGKSLLLERLLKPVCQGQAGNIPIAAFLGPEGMMETSNARGALARNRVAISSDTPALQLSNPALKSALSGEPVTYRRIGQNANEYRPNASIVAATNEFIGGLDDQSLNRRIALVEMADHTATSTPDGTPQPWFQDFIDWVTDPDSDAQFAMMAVSCELWAACPNEDPDVVHIAGRRFIKDNPFVQAIIRGIVLTTTPKPDGSMPDVWDGFAADRWLKANDVPIPSPSSREWRDAKQIVGLARRRAPHKLEGYGGTRPQVWQVMDDPAAQALFDRYAAPVWRDLQVERAEDEAEEKAQVEQAERTAEQSLTLADMVPAHPEAGLDETVVRMDEDGVAGVLFPVAQDKRPLGKWGGYEAPDDHVDADRIGPDTAMAGLRPARDIVVVDCDVPEGEADKGKPDGFTVLQSMAGAYGSDGLPRTFSARTRSGGLHLYYRLAPGQSPLPVKAHQGRFAVMPVMGKPVSYAAGVPVDLRVGTTRSFAIAPGSQSPEGSWAIVDDMPVTVMPDSLHAALQRLADLPNGHGDRPVNVDAHGEPAADPDGVDVDLFDRKTGGASQTNPDGTHWHPRAHEVIGEGARNETMNSYYFGRLLHSPKNGDTPEQVKADLFAQARASGLPDSETEGIWRSIVKGVSKKGGPIPADRDL
ncbi:DNA primase/polymerase [Bifidobacterium thermophilum]|uniref:bifunctional DNA primase/polymerase n=1 Tax=Bifidobacterium thermophilum TaxID=33905 RepID=UPI000C7037E9|nr:bifunctional DNA primase/polymerase [Bifidobacterium thermophilum]PKU89305.1 DNA primase/polymerase [Bifidobacterium thermophilum]